MVHTCTLQVEHSLRSPVPSLKESLQPKKRRAVRQALLPSPALETNEKGGEGTKERDGKEGEEGKEGRNRGEGRRKEGRTQRTEEPQVLPVITCGALLQFPMKENTRKKVKVITTRLLNPCMKRSKSFLCLENLLLFSLAPGQLHPPPFFFFFAMFCLRGEGSSPVYHLVNSQRDLFKKLFR